MGDVVPLRGGPAAVRRVPAQVSVHPEDAAGPAPGHPGPAHQQLPPQDPAAVRVRETPQRGG